MFVVALLFPQTRHDSPFWNLGKGDLELGKFDIPPDQTTSRALGGGGLVLTAGETSPSRMFQLCIFV